MRDLSLGFKTLNRAKKYTYIHLTFVADGTTCLYNAGHCFVSSTRTKSPPYVEIVGFRDNGIGTQMVNISPKLCGIRCAT
jgi:hypothetical protein